MPPTGGPSTTVCRPTLTAAFAAASASGVLAWPGVAPPSGTSPSAWPRSSTSDCGLQPPPDGIVNASTLWPLTLTTVLPEPL